MRLWVGPDGQLINLDDGEEMAHSWAVCIGAADYGLDPEPVADHRRKFDAGEVDLDYDLLITMAEMAGWSRISRDAKGTSLAISGSSIENCRAALKAVRPFGLNANSFYLEIEVIDGNVLRRSHCDLSTASALSRFEKFGVHPPMKTYTWPITDNELLCAWTNTQLVAPKF